MQTREMIVLVASLAVAGCGNETVYVPDGTGGEIDTGSGGKVGSGGSGLPGSGGKVGSGGSGLPGSGGSDGSGGSGMPGSGGKVGSGGTGSGGKLGSGGAGSGGAVGTGGAGSGGKLGSGGTGSGGKLGSGGAGSGGAVGTGGTTIISNCSEANKTVTNNGIGQHCGYTYEYWKDSGTGTLTLKPDGYSVSWSGINNLLGRKGIRPGNGNLAVTYEANYQPVGNSYLCVYGWTRNPLIEYYIVDSWGTWRPPGGTSVGTVDSDGGTYDIYKTQRVDKPSIDGDKTTFWQYWSVRKDKRSSGTITVANHFAAWAKQGLTMGTFYEVSMTVEGYQSSGTADVKMMIK